MLTARDTLGATFHGWDYRNASPQPTLTWVLETEFRALCKTNASPAESSLVTFSLLVAFTLSAFLRSRTTLTGGTVQS